MGIYEGTECMNIFFDLDGTLVDASDRLYNLFQHLVPASDLTKDAYWKLKRNKVGHREILQTHHEYSDQQIEVFENTWLSMIELNERIAQDKPFAGVTDYLRNLKKVHTLYIVTARQSRETAVSQIKNYEWSDVFKDVLVTGHQMEKSELIKSECLTAPNDWFVGDTGKDIETGKQLGLQTAAVFSGFLSKEKLAEYKPDIIANSVVELNFESRGDSHV